LFDPSANNPPVNSAKQVI